MGRKPKAAKKQNEKMDMHEDFEDFDAEMEIPVGGESGRPENEEMEPEPKEDTLENLIEECTIQCGKALLARPDTYYRNGPEVKSWTAQAADLGYALAEEILTRKIARDHIRERAMSNEG